MIPNIEMIKDVPQFREWQSIEVPETGWSMQHTFKVTDRHGQAFILKVDDISLTGERRAEFDNFERMLSLGINVSKPVSFGVCNGGRSVYMLMGWIDGVAVEDVIKNYDGKTQYDLGVKSGKILRRIHDNSPVDSGISWASRFGSHIDNTVSAYYNTKITICCEKAILDYIGKHRHLLAERPQVTTHGDFHVGNLIIMPDGEIGIIDGEICNHSDAWEEFGGIVWAARLSGRFAKGQVDGYFDGHVPEGFFKLLALYIGVYALGHVVRAVKHGTDEDAIRDIMANTDFMGAMFCDFTIHIPSWY